MALNSPQLGGDASGTLHNVSVDKIKAHAVSTTAPTSGQVLTWNGSAWAPATPSTGGGGGSNGLTYYLNQGTSPDAPTTGLFADVKQLGRVAEAGQTLLTSPTLTENTWVTVAAFVSESTPIDPATGSIPAGIWDFNAWASSNANSNAPTSLRAQAYVYKADNSLVLLGTSAGQVLGSTLAQASVSVVVAQTTTAQADRIYIVIQAQATGTGHTVTLGFGDGTPSHVHTSLPLVGGTGLWKNVSGVLQSPATLLVDADVDVAAAIAQSKIAGLTTDLAGKAASTVTQVFNTVGTSTWTKPAGAKQIVVECLSGGGGGGAGGKAASGTAVFGGGGGGGGGYSRVAISAADLTDATYTVTVGAGGTGAIYGGNATAGSASSFAPSSTPTAFLARAASGSAPGGSGGVTSPTAGSGGAPNSNAGGGSSITANASAGSASTHTATGGGGGGGISAVPTGYAGGQGGTNAICNLASLGGATSGSGNGVSATASTPRTGSSLIINGSGGGGGGSSTFATGSGGNGANGSGYGSGGGGGGATIGSGSGGAGGNGAQGIVVVTTYF